jgi:hypothetical protein
LKNVDVYLSRGPPNQNTNPFHFTTPFTTPNKQALRFRYMCSNPLFFVRLGGSLQCEKKRLEFGLLKCFQADVMLCHISSVIPCGFAQQQKWHSNVAGCSILVLSAQNSFERFNCSLLHKVVPRIKARLQALKTRFFIQFFKRTSVSFAVRGLFDIRIRFQAFQFYSIFWLCNINHNPHSNLVISSLLHVQKTLWRNTELNLRITPPPPSPKRKLHL